ncbi:hypothetical protein DL95DRAFT_316692, partial [Leptodontidium sp. 2 PMI_412]
QLAMIASLDIVVLLLASLLAGSVISIPPEHEQYVANPGTFQNPAAEVRPKFRYWLPDASIDPAGIAADFKHIGSIGAGGIELCNYYLYGGQIGTPVSDWSVYGFGTPAYNKILRAAAQAIKDNGLVIDLAIGPESGQGVPAEWDNRKSFKPNLWRPRLLTIAAADLAYDLVTCFRCSFVDSVLMISGFI